MTSTSIFLLSFDEGSGWSSAALSTACTITPWGFFLGLVTVYAALFSKMWRVDRVLRMQRQTVRTVQVLGPLIVLLAITIALLTAWTVADPWVWNRELLIGMTPPESYGQCSSDSFIAYFTALAAVTVISSTLAVVLAWKTANVPNALSDTKAVFYAVATHLQAWFVGLPILAALGQDSSTATYLGRVLLVFVFGVSTNAFVICPTLYRIWRASKVSGDASRKSRVRITGLDFDPSSDRPGLMDCSHKSSGRLTDATAYASNKTLTAESPPTSDG